jgi:integrase
MVEIKWNLFQRPDDGAWVASVKPDGARAWRQIRAPGTVTSKRAAETWMRVVLEKIRASGGVLPKAARGASAREGMRIEEMVSRVIAYRDGKSTGENPQIRPQTARSGRGLSKHFLTGFAGKEVASVGVPEARAFVRALNERFAPLVVRNLVTWGKLAWDVAIAEAWITGGNPFANAMVRREMGKFRTVAGKPIAMTLSMADALVNGSEVPAFDRVRYCLSIGLGICDGELAGFRVGDVVTEEVPARIHVVRQYVRGGKGKMVMGPPKTDARERWVPLSPAACAALRWWLGGEWQRRVGRDPRAGDPLFPKMDGSPWHRVNRGEIRKHLAAMGQPTHVEGKEEGKLVPVTFHATRRTFSSLMNAVGVTDTESGAMMGHAGTSIIAKHYIDRDFPRLASLVALHPLTFSPSAPRVRTSSGGAHASALSARDIIDNARKMGGARRSSCIAAARHCSTPERSKLAKVLLEGPGGGVPPVSGDPAHTPLGDVRTSFRTRHEALACAFAALEWRGSW